MYSLNKCVKVGSSYGSAIHQDIWHLLKDQEEFRLLHKSCPDLARQVHRAPGGQDRALFFKRNFIAVLKKY